ncbi:hypothetical protein B0H16DRAFT_1560175 [Mycena metata]|uniref:Uncharacterized protein n=1 Tax=Mycena metata TaxID=1033252 RepID=A0AAD7N3L8_9AGAR|nr:hypothetical protein B0H16DRAFT_1560175 [Mycena metata]
MSLISEVNYSEPSSRPRRQRSFSLAEFRALVSAALDPDSMNASLLFSFNSAGSPASTPPSSPTSSTPSSAFVSASSAPSAPTAIRTLERKKSLPSLHSQPTQSRVRLLLVKFKKRAAAFVRRRRGSHSSLHKPGVRSVHFQVQTIADEGELLFEPYLPLAAQYERARGGAGAVYPFLLLSTPNTSLANASFASPSSEESYYPFSAHTAQSEDSNTPPSPTASTFSSASSSADRCSSAASPAHSYSGCITEPERPWSVATYDSGLAGVSSASPSSFPTAPFGYDHEDPFAKGAVRVVHHSCEALPHPTVVGSGYWLRESGTYNPGGETRRARKGRAKRVRRDSGVDVDEVHVPVEQTDGKQRTMEKEQSSPPSSFPSSPSNSNSGPASSSSAPPSSLSLARAHTHPTETTPRTRTLRRTRPSSPFPLSRGLTC